MKCRICGNEKGNKTFIVNEMMFGTKEKFEYLECAACGCLQLVNIPGDLSKYYPNEYNAFDKQSFIEKNRLLNRLQNKKVKYLLNENKSLLGWGLNIIKRDSFENKLVDAGVKTTYKILDIGSGTGGRLIRMRKKGFTDLTGSDLFIKENIVYDEGLRILKKDIRDIKEKYDFIMMNHSFEHFLDPLTTLKIIYQLLKPDRFLLIRIPVAASYAWGKYKTNWVALDAPRHIFIHTQKSMQVLANETGFQMTKVNYDSSEYQFIGSEQYKNNISLHSEKSYFVNPRESMFNSKDIKTFRKKAKELNKKQKGDAACFYFYKKG